MQIEANRCRYIERWLDPTNQCWAPAPSEKVLAINLFYWLWLQFPLKRLSSQFPDSQLLGLGAVFRSFYRGQPPLNTFNGFGSCSGPL